MKKNEHNINKVISILYFNQQEKENLGTHDWEMSTNTEDIRCINCKIVAYKIIPAGDGIRKLNPMYNRYCLKHDEDSYYTCDEIVLRDVIK